MKMKKEDLKKKEGNVDPYHSFHGFSSSSPEIKCMAGEPDFVNSNGYHNVIQVLKSIGERAGVKQYGKGQREQLLVECDGLPYDLIRDIIHNVLRCSECKKCFYGLTSFKEHKCFIITEHSFEFSWLVPIPGLLHLEMNLGRAFVKMNWDIFVRDVGICLGPRFS